METMSQQTNKQTRIQETEKEYPIVELGGWLDTIDYQIKIPVPVKVIFFELLVSKVIYSPQTLQTVVIVIC